MTFTGRRHESERHAAPPPLDELEKRSAEYARGRYDGRHGLAPTGSWFGKPRRSHATELERLYLDGFNAGRQERGDTKT